MNSVVQELLAGDKGPTGRVDMMLRAAQFAAAAYAGFGPDQVRKILRAAADAGFAQASRLGEDAVKETGFGVAEHKKIKNELTTRGLHEAWSNLDFCSKRVIAEKKIVELPRSAGVVFALTPSTNPVCTVFFKIMLALVTRNAIVVSPHPMARKCSTDAARIMAAAAEAAGAPIGIVQVIDEPSMPLIDHAMRSPMVNVILATGGTPMVRAAYGSGNPAIGVGPGNAPALVDASADIDSAAKRIVLSKSFDNSILCTNESVVIAETAIADKLVQALARAGAYIAKPEEVALLRDYLFGKGNFNIEALGRSAAEIGAKVGLRLPASVKIILAEIDRIGIDEALSKEKLCPVLGFLRVPHAQAGIGAAKALIRLSGAGHSAAIHSRTPATILAYGAAVKVLRVAVNAPCSQGAAGFATHLAPTFTIGTGFFGGSSIGENIGPEHLVNWTRIAYSSEPSEVFGDFGTLEPWQDTGRIALGRDVPMTLGRLQEGAEQAPANDEDLGPIRDEIRRIVLEELRSVLKTRPRA